MYQKCPFKTFSRPLQCFKCLENFKTSTPNAANIHRNRSASHVRILSSTPGSLPVTSRLLPVTSGLPPVTSEARSDCHQSRPYHVRMTTSHVRAASGIFGGRVRTSLHNIKWGCRAQELDAEGSPSGFRVYRSGFMVRGSGSGFGVERGFCQGAGKKSQHQL